MISPQEKLDTIERKFEEEWKGIKGKIPEMFKHDRVILNEENCKILCQGFFIAGAQNGLKIINDELKGLI